MMSNNHAIGDGTIMQFVGKAVGVNCLAVYPKFAIASSHVRAHPLPTLVGAALVYLLPKTDDRINAPVVAGNKAFRLALDPSISGAGLERNWGELSTTTLAITIGNFVGGVVRGIMGLHRNLSFLCQVPGRYQRRWDNCVSAFIIAQMGRSEKRL